MSDDPTTPLVPRLRFPEFQRDGGWKTEPLSNISQEITEKTKGRKYTLMSITSGVGLVSQIEKFGKEIAGNSYKNYYVISKGDFAYNKSATKLYPAGEIAVLENLEQAAVPNSIFTCFRFNKNIVDYNFAKYFFWNNFHGKWLTKFIAVGARAHGALQVNSKDLFSIPFCYPSLKEQQKIAACLSSLDDVIDLEQQKLALLRQHKKGLMQQLFPRAGESEPRLRFPEFKQDGGWEEKSLRDTLIQQRQRNKELKYNLVLSVNNRKGIVLQSEQFIDKQVASSDVSTYKIVRRGDVAYNPSRINVGSIALLEQFEVGIVSPMYVVFKTKETLDTHFLLYLIDTHTFRQKIKLACSGSVRDTLSFEALCNLTTALPHKKEQQKSPPASPPPMRSSPHKSRRSKR